MLKLMPRTPHRHRLPSASLVAAVALFGVTVTFASYGPALGEARIEVLVNDDPITSFAIDQRVRFNLQSSSAVGDYLRQRVNPVMRQKLQSEETNKRFREFMVSRKPKSREEAQQLQKVFIAELQKETVEALRREALGKLKGNARSKAVDQLIDEQLKLQEARRMNTLVTTDEVDEFTTSIAQRNKLTLEQFAAMLRKDGVSIDTLKGQIRASVSFKRAVATKYRHQISVSEAQVDKRLGSAVAGDAKQAAAGPSGGALQIQQISVSLSGARNEEARFQRLQVAESLRERFTSCRETQDLASKAGSTTVKSLGALQPSKLAQPAQGLVLKTEVGKVTPPIFSSTAIELYAICGRADEKAVSTEAREKAKAELRETEMANLEKRLLRDLRDQATIERR